MQADEGSILGRLRWIPEDGYAIGARLGGESDDRAGSFAGEHHGGIGEACGSSFGALEFDKPGDGARFPLLERGGKGCEEVEIFARLCGGCA